ncbi:MAG: LptE family protein [Bdellovibrionaceae bacterium]|nr:LptE family protein [Pseudobdellovibrionaceae bacterium]
MQMRLTQIYPSRLPAVIKALIAAVRVIALVGLIASSVALSGCAYRTGGPDRSLPGGYTQIHIPIFKNKTQEVGIEVGFTNALVQEFERSRSARVVSPEYAEAEVEGEIQSVIYQPGGIQGGDKFPKGSVLASEYRVLLVVRVALKRKSDNAELWSGSFQGERTYVAPQVLQAGVNTVNPLYNLSARRQNIENMASDLMSEAHDRMSENF